MAKRSALRPSAIVRAKQDPVETFPSQLSSSLEPPIDPYNMEVSGTSPQAPYAPSQQPSHLPFNLFTLSPASTQTADTPLPVQPDLKAGFSVSGAVSQIPKLEPPQQSAQPATAPIKSSQPIARLAPKPFFNKVGSASSDVAYFVPHGDESTAKKVLQDHLASNPGMGLVSPSNTRSLKGVNPNAVFGSASPISQEAEQFLFGPQHKLVVALHNTVGKALNAELKRSDSMQLNDKSYGGYILTTDRNLYHDLAQTSPYNVILQEKTTKENDDGSASRRAAVLGKKYVNVEAVRGDYTKQAEMLKAVMSSYRKIYGKWMPAVSSGGR